MTQIEILNVLGDQGDHGNMEKKIEESMKQNVDERFYSNEEQSRANVQELLDDLERKVKEFKKKVEEFLENPSREEKPAK